MTTYLRSICIKKKLIQSYIKLSQLSDTAEFEAVSKWREKACNVC